MKRIILAAMIAAAPASFALAADAENKAHPAEKAMDQATPAQKNPDGTDKLHGPQKAMDQATPTQKKTDSVDGAGSGTSGEGKTYNSEEANKASEAAGQKQKVPDPSSK